MVPVFRNIASFRVASDVLPLIVSKRVSEINFWELYFVRRYIS